MTSRKKKTKPQDTREKILETTLQLFLKKGGGSATSTTDICKAAKVARPSLYHYFGSKRHLVFSLHMDKIVKELKPYLAEASSIVDPLERLSFMIRWFVRNISLHPELRYLIHDSLAIKDRYFGEVRREWKKHYSLLRETIRELQAQGRIDPGLKVSWAALFILGMMTWMTFWLDYDRKDQIDDIAEAAVEFVARGLDCRSRHGAAAHGEVAPSPGEPTACQRTEDHPSND